VIGPHRVVLPTAAPTRRSRPGPAAPPEGEAQREVWVRRGTERKNCREEKDTREELNVFVDV